MTTEQNINGIIEIVKIACKSAITVYLVDGLSTTEFKKAYSKMLNSIQSHLETLFDFDSEILSGLIKVAMNQISIESGEKRIYI